MSKRGVKKRPWLSSTVIVMLVHFCSNWMQQLEGSCVPRNGCSTALAFYNVTAGDTLDALASRFQTTIAAVDVYNNINSENTLYTGTEILFPFPCECAGDHLGHSYSYTVQQDDKYSTIANNKFEGLTTVDEILEDNHFTNSTVLNPGDSILVPVHCSCGNSTVSTLFGLFATYPALSTDNASSLATKFQISQAFVEQYNPSVNWNGALSGSEILFIPVRDASTGLYPPYNFSNDGSSSSNTALIVGVSVGGVAGLLLIILGLCLGYHLVRRQPRKRRRAPLEVPGSRESMLKSSSGGSVNGPAALSDFTVDKSVEFSFEELAAATNNFNIANKVGEGGYGAVYFATLRGQNMAVKRMNLQATREFLAELQVLTRVHHTNLVQLIGYCTVESLFLIYEYVENGTLDRHLHGKNDLPPLSWADRVQIALDAARGLEYIHEHTKPTYIHRDVKSSNILIDMQLRAKVADFGLTKLTESVSGSYPTRLVGTFGYMSPEYARFGDVSPKIDVYAFGVVLFEIISAKEAIVRSVGSSSPAGQQRGLVTMFEEVLADGEQELGSLVDPALEGNYPLDTAWKLTQLAGSCTKENPELRPSMRSVVVALMSLSSRTQEWDMSTFESNPVRMSMSGR